MTLKSLLLAAVLASAAMGAQANNVNGVILLDGASPSWTGTFGTSHTAGAFTDSFTLNNFDYTTLIDGGFTNFSTKLSNSISFTSATLNGYAFDLYTAPVGGSVTVRGGYLPDEILSNANSLTLVIKGTSGANASYTGNLNISAVPEPATYGMLLGGLALMGLVARRRNKNAA